ncbi:MAG: hypothetical protein K0S33_1863 [Bacteroidetes bacterium]|jgi:hypothetical protein|nr:hypothetical protein [Bacteroidota bacterium]
MKKQVLLLFKILLGVACFVFLWLKLHNQFSDEKIGNLKNTLQDPGALWLLLLAVVLVIPNWLIESYKWKRITESIERISFGNALKGVLAGLCIGNLTPGRFGEFAGRILYFSPDNRSKASVTHFVCGATQLFITLVFGVISGVFWLLRSGDWNSFYVIILVICIVLLAALFFILLNIESAYKKVARFSFLQRFKLGAVSYPRPVLLELTGWSALRYLVFSTQYILLLKSCGAYASYTELFVPVSISFMLMSAIPMISFIEVAIRASIAVILFSTFNSNELLLVTASTLLWCINLVLPSIAGYFIILSTRIKLKETVKAL